MSLIVSTTTGKVAFVTNGPLASPNAGLVVAPGFGGQAATVSAVGQSAVGATAHVAVRSRPVVVATPTPTVVVLTETPAAAANVVLVKKIKSARPAHPHSALAHAHNVKHMAAGGHIAAGKGHNK